MMCAQDYAGGGKIYSKEVSIKDAQQILDKAAMTIQYIILALS